MELLKSTLEVSKHLLNLLSSPSVFSLEIINGVLSTIQNCFERVCFVNFLHSYFIPCLVNFHSKINIPGRAAEFFIEAFLCRLLSGNLPHPIVYSVHALPV